MRRTIRRKIQPGFRDSCTEFHNDSGQSLLETTLFLLLPMLLAVFAVDFGYFFIVAANLISSARNAVKYSIQGVESPGQSSLAAAEPLTSTDSVSALAVGYLSGLTDSSTTTTVEACPKASNAAQNTTQCNSYGPAVASHAPGIDPEAPTFLLSRVDGTYTVHPPIPISFVSCSLMPSLPFHRQVSMRVVD